jgi:uncharacterized membrane protein YfhO
LLTLFDLATFNSHNRLNTHLDRAYDVTPKRIGKNSAIISFLKREATQAFNQGQLFRIAPVSVESLWSNGPMLWGLHSIGGYSSLRLKAYDDFIKTARFYESHLFEGLVKSFNSPLFDLLNVRYVITTKRLEELDPQVDPQKFKLVYNIGYNIYENLKFMPRAFIVHSAKIVDSDEEAKDVLLNQPVDFTRTIVIKDSKKLLPSTFENQTEGIIPSSPAKIVKYHPDEIVVDTSLEQDGFLFISDVYYPGWKAYVDGKESKIYQANLVFRAVFLGKGKHTVKFMFRPKTFIAGLIISVSTFLLVIAFLVYTVIRRVLHKKVG